MLGQAHDKSGHQQALDVRILVGHIQGVFVVGAAVRTNRSARLHRVGHQAVVDQVEFGNVRCFGKRSVNLCFVTNRPFVAMVVRSDFVQSRGFGGIAHIYDRRQNVVFDVNQLSGVTRLLQSFSDHHGDVVADIAHLALGQDGVSGFFHRLAAGVGNQPTARQSIDAVACDVFAIKNTDHARGRQSSFYVDRFDMRMRMG